MPTIAVSPELTAKRFLSTKDPACVSSAQLEPFRKLERAEIGWVSWQVAIVALRNARSLQAGWDSYDAEPPSMSAISTMWALVEYCSNRPLPGVYRVMPSSEGGMTLAFSLKDRLAQMEILNSGSVLLTTIDDQGISVVGLNLVEPDELNRALQTIQNFLGR